MFRDEKILITGPAGQIALPLCRYLATDNEVWGVARFSQPGSRDSGGEARSHHPGRRPRRRRLARCA